MSGGSKKKSNKKAAKADAIEASSEKHSLVRPVTNHTINPRSILTGFYQKNGKRVQHTVHDGALQMPKDALDVIETATNKLTDKSHKPISNYALPGLDTVVRPSLDPKLETIVVTELVMEKVQIPQEQPAPLGPDLQPIGPPTIKMIKTSRPSAKNKRIKRVKTTTTTTQAVRIRGGGDAPVPLNPGQAAPSVPQAAVAPPAVAPMAVAPPAQISAPAPPAVATPAAAAPVVNPSVTTAAATMPVRPPTAVAPAPVPVAFISPSASAPAIVGVPTPAATPAVAPTIKPLAVVQSQATAVAKPPATTTPVLAPTIKPLPTVQPQAAAIAKPPAPTPAVAPAVKTESSAPSSAAAAAATTTTPAAIPSSAPAAKPAPVKQEEEKKPAVPEAKALASKPAPQWEQHKPGPNDETITPENQLSPRPEWYKKDSIHEVERTMLPEWFDASAAHRTPESYVKAREKIIQMSMTLSNRNVTNAMIRRSILGDAGSLQRLRKFLVNWGIINRDGINDSAPTTESLRPDLKRPVVFTTDMKESLVLAVTEQASKKRKLGATSPALSLDWDEIASKVGFGVSAEKCRENFMTTPLKDDNAMDVSSDDAVTSQSQEDVVQDLVKSSNPKVIQKVFDAAMEATDSNPVDSKAASLLGLHMTQAVENARGHEVDLAVRLSKLLEARMQKLENRMAMMDDVEGILEAEKVALEMERRDLYTARCRHWFGGV
eukprot:CAMPEP_0116144386 /NCGR_PEP_ID=MMETSP0329-20121206/15979_1 /TAXON_ID=697910 /ORGANISM="Pseudo-nitzschia arenysensis, Strain B593" /LENGTH=716 /DNA_ID=CAMNT_0003639815 /DNA_START=28 /DNA_END=2178 /DNA_ORIENTATION=+